MTYIENSAHCIVYQLLGTKMIHAVYSIIIAVINPALTTINLLDF